jgi:predicted enzyme related to lactoylglutathione lyase
LPRRERAFKNWGAPALGYYRWDVFKEASMKWIYTTALAVFATVPLASVACAQVTVNSTRIAAKDSVAVAKFYESAFGMHETNRLQGAGGPELFVNFGDTVEAAKANKGQPIVIQHRDSDDVKDPVAHVILNVKDLAATIAAIKSAGGTIASEPRSQKGTVFIAIAVDPAGNRIELISRP